MSLTKDEVLRPLARRRGDAIVVATMAAVRPWGQLSGSTLDFASADSAMGHAADFALGLALAQPRRKVICLNGDGSMLMSLGTLVTIVASGAENLVLFVLQNERYELTGNQLVPGAGRVDFTGLARAAGFPRVHGFLEAAAYETALNRRPRGPARRPRRPRPRLCRGQGGAGDVRAARPRPCRARSLPASLPRRIGPPAPARPRRHRLEGQGSRSLSVRLALATRRGRPCWRRRPAGALHRSIRCSSTYRV